VAAGAVNGYGVIVGVNTGLHETPFFRVRSARQPRQGRSTTAASLGREAIDNYTRKKGTIPNAIGGRSISVVLQGVELTLELGYVLEPD